MRVKWQTWTGIGVLLGIVLTYFIKVQVDSGFNFIVNTRLLSLLIFHNPFILGLYLLIGIGLIVRGLSSENKGRKKN